MSLIEQIKADTMAGKANNLENLINQAIDSGIKVNDIINNAFISAMTIVGDKFSRQEIFVPEMLVAARAMNIGLEILKPRLLEAERTYAGKILMGTVQGDLHDIGKNLIGIMLRSSGYEVVDLGVDVKSGKFIEAIKEHKPDIVGFAALLTTTLKFMKENIVAIKDANLRNDVKIIVGGAPVTPDFANEIGADRYVDNAGEVVKIVSELVGAK